MPFSVRMVFGDAVRKHNEGECLDVFKVYIVGRQILEEDRTVFLTFANVWDLLNIFRAVGSGYAVQLHGELQVPTNVCQTHATAIAANNGSHKTHFDNMARYEEFYEYVCRIMRCSFVDAGERLQELLVQFLRSVGETRAADWFSEWWCGPVKGRWLLGHGGSCITPNNCPGGHVAMGSTRYQLRPRGKISHLAKKKPHLAKKRPHWAKQ